MVWAWILDWSTKGFSLQNGRIFGNKILLKTLGMLQKNDMFLELRNANYISSEMITVNMNSDSCASSLGLYHM